MTLLKRIGRAYLLGITVSVCCLSVPYGAWVMLHEPEPGLWAGDPRYDPFARRIPDLHHVSYSKRIRLVLPEHTPEGFRVCAFDGQVLGFDEEHYHVGWSDPALLDEHVERKKREWRETGGPR